MMGRGPCFVGSAGVGFDAPVGEYGNVVVPSADFSSKWDEGTEESEESPATCT